MLQKKTVDDAELIQR